MTTDLATVPESHRDLLNRDVAVLGTIADDGRPQLTAVWFVADDQGIRISLNNTRQKVKNLERNPMATLFILDLENPFRYVEIRGDVDIVPDEDGALVAKVQEKYGTDVRSMDQPGEFRVVVRLHPVRVNVM